MAHCKIQLYNVPDKHLYDPLPLRAIHAFRVASWRVQLALVCYGTGAGLLISHYLVRCV